MKELGLLASDHAREPLAPLSESGRQKVQALLERSPHVDRVGVT
jgi:dihydrodipicolinate synthase/N-acetylneuraminate lyase